MARRVFFSFHYERDSWRANVVRKSWVTQNREDAGFWDASLWEEAKKKGDYAIKRMIDEGLNNTTVTAVLIGTETSSRPWVKYEIEGSFRRGNSFLGIYIHNIRDEKGKVDKRGANPLDHICTERGGKELSEIFPTYDWVSDNGYANFGSWVEKAAKAASRTDVRSYQISLVSSPRPQIRVIQAPVASHQPPMPRMRSSRMPSRPSYKPHRRGGIIIQPNGRVVRQRRGTVI